MLKNGKLISILKSFDRQELSELKKYLKKNGAQKELLLFEILENAYPDFQSKKLTKESLFTIFFPQNRTYKDHRIRRLFSDFTKKTEDFLIYRHYQKREIEKAELLNRIYGERNLYEVFTKSKDAIFKFRATHCPDTDSFLNDFELLNRFYFHPKTEKRNSRAVLDEAVNALDKFYVGQRLKIECEYENRFNIFPDKKEFVRHPDFDHILSGNHSTVLFNKIKLLHQSYDLNEFQNAKKYYSENRDLLSIRDQKLILTHLLNLMMRQVNKIGVSAYKEVLDLYKIGLASRVLIENDTLTIYTYNNIVSAGCVSEEYEWTAEFIEQYADYLSKPVKESTKDFALASLLFVKKEYSAVIDLLKAWDHPEIQFKINARTLLIRSGLEMFLTDQSWDDVIESNCHSFKRFIQRNKVLPLPKKKAYLNFIDFIRKIIQLYYLPKRLVRKKQLIKEIKETELLYGRKWLKEKLET